MVCGVMARYTHLVCDVIDNDNTICSPIVARSDCPEPLLTSCIPLCVDECADVSTLVPLSCFVTVVFNYHPNDCIPLKQTLNGKYALIGGMYLTMHVYDMTNI